MSALADMEAVDADILGAALAEFAPWWELNRSRLTAWPAPRAGWLLTVHDRIAIRLGRTPALDPHGKRVYDADIVAALEPVIDMTVGAYVTTLAEFVRERVPGGHAMVLDERNGRARTRVLGNSAALVHKRAGRQLAQSYLRAGSSFPESFEWEIRAAGGHWRGESLRAQASYDVLIAIRIAGRLLIRTWRTSRSKNGDKSVSLTDTIRSVCSDGSPIPMPVVISTDTPALRTHLRPRSRSRGQP